MCLSTIDYGQMQQRLRYFPPMANIHGIHLNLLFPMSTQEKASAYPAEIIAKSTEFVIRRTFDYDGTRTF